MSAATGTFHELVGQLDYSMLIVTADADDADAERAGCLVDFGGQSSIDPSRFLVCLSRANRTYRVAGTSEMLAVHFVPRRAEPLAELFGGRSGDDVDRFARCGWHPGPAGLPILDECGNWFAGRVLEFHRAKHIEPGHSA